MKQTLSFLLTLLAFTGFTQVNQIDVKKAVVRNTIIYQGDTLAIVAVGHAATYDTLFVTRGSVLDTLIVSSVRELDNLSDVVLTTPDASDILMLDDETMKWVNYPFSNLIGDINDSLPNYWYLDGDTIKTIYNVVVDSSFVMNYNGWNFGYFGAGSAESIVSSKIDDSDGVVNITYNDNGNYMWYVQTLNAGGTVSGVVGIDTNGTVRTYMGAEIAGQVSSIQVYPTYITIKSDSTVIDGDLTVTGDVTIFPLPDEATKVGRIAHINQYGKIEWVSPLKLYEEQLDTASEMSTPSPFTMWARDTTNGIIYTLNDTDIVRMNNIKVIEVPNQSEFIGSIYFGNGGELCDTTTGVIDPIDPLPAESSGSLNAKYNTFIGIGSGIANITGNYNLFVGSLAGKSNINGDQNTFIGHSAGRQNVSGYHQTGIGAGALDKNNGYFNIAIGTDCMLGDTTGNFNTIVGTSAAGGAKSIERCTALGAGALGFADTNLHNTAVGYFSLSGYKGNYNTALGYATGIGDTTGSFNTYVGYNATTSDDNATNSTAIGNGATISKSNQVAIGNSSVTETVLRGNVLMWGDLNMQTRDLKNVDSLFLGAANVRYDGTSINFSAGVKIAGTNYLYFNTTSYNIRGGSNVMEYDAPKSHSFETNGTAKLTIDSWELMPATNLGIQLGDRTKRWGNTWTRNISDTVGFTKISGNLSVGANKTPSYTLDVVGTGYFSQNLITAGSFKSGTGTITNNDSTPSVANYNTFVYAGSANAVSIDALDDHVVGCYYTIIGNSNTYTITVIDGTPAGGDSFNLAGGNWVGGSQDVLLLYCIAADAFIEVSRSDN